MQTTNSNTATKNKIKLAGIKVGGKVTSLSLLRKEILKQTNLEFDRNDSRVQINVSCSMGILADHLPHLVADSKKFCSSPTAENLAHIEASLLLLSSRIKNIIRS